LILKSLETLKLCSSNYHVNQSHRSITVNVIIISNKNNNIYQYEHQ